MDELGGCQELRYSLAVAAAGAHGRVHLPTDVVQLQDELAGARPGGDRAGEERGVAKQTKQAHQSGYVVGMIARRDESVSSDRVVRMRALKFEPRDVVRQRHGELVAIALIVGL